MCESVIKRKKVIDIYIYIYVLVPNELSKTNDYYLSRCVTLAKATANACKALKGYWKSNV